MMPSSSLNRPNATVRFLSLLDALLGRSSAEEGEGMCLLGVVAVIVAAAVRLWVRLRVGLWSLWQDWSATRLAPPFVLLLLIAVAVVVEWTILILSMRN